MSNGKRFTGRLAVAAVAVAGVLGGTAWADLLGPYEVEMSVSFEVAIEDTARIEIAKSNPLTKDELWTGGLDAANVGGENPGSLGIIRVTTTHDNWDVTMKTLYGGKLVFSGEDKPAAGVHCPTGWEKNPWNGNRCQKTGEADIDALPNTTPGEMHSLLYIDKALSTATEAGAVNTGGAAARDTVQLVVKIGVCNLGADLDPDAVQTGYYALGAPADYTNYSPVAIASAKLLNTRKYEADGSDASQKPVSFAEEIGNAYNGGSGAIDGLNSREWSAIATAGTNFAKPAYGPGSGRSVEHFFINVGLNNTNAIYEHNSQNGTYGETFTFTLVAAF
jgi:hypothetical protein